VSAINAQNGKVILDVNSVNFMSFQKKQLAYREIPMYICAMNHVEIFKALASPTRLQILAWFKTPEYYFPDQQEPFITGICVGQIQKKTGMTQSTISENLSVMQRAGLLISTHKGQWTYYKRNEAVFQELSLLC
jgi:ArsR family transcriptional regulator